MTSWKIWRNWSVILVQQFVLLRLIYIQFSCSHFSSFFDYGTSLFNGLFSVQTPFSPLFTSLPSVNLIHQMASINNMCLLSFKTTLISGRIFLPTVSIPHCENIHSYEIGMAENDRDSKFGTYSLVMFFRAYTDKCTAFRLVKLR